MAKLKIKVVQYFSFFCPGCGHEHVYPISDDNTGWQFNNNMESPSFTPSLLNRKLVKNEKYVEGGNEQEHIEKSRCHLFVTDGKINYYSDCSHQFSGQTLELKEY